MSYIFKSDVDDDIESLLKELELEQDTLPKYRNKSFNLNSDFSKYNNDSKKTDSDDLKKSKSNIKFENNSNATSDEINDLLQELSLIDSPPIPKKNYL
jgi:hypothetical protein